MVYKKDTTLGQTKEFDAQIQVLDIPNEIKAGFSKPKRSCGAPQFKGHFRTSGPF